MIKSRSRGFTLVEILVVIAIIATLVGTTAVMAPKLMKKGQQTKVVANMRQMISTLTAYTTEHSNRLPPPVTRSEDSEAKVDTYWYMYCEQLMTNGELEEVTRDKYWKEKKQNIFLNPMHPKKDLKKTSVGYAMNALLASNLAASRGESIDPEVALSTAINTVNLRDPERAPIVMPYWSWSYKCDKAEAGSAKFKPYLVSERLPVLFLDGHIETLSPEDYVKRKLDRFPEAEK